MHFTILSKLDFLLNLGPVTTLSTMIENIADEKRFI